MPKLDFLGDGACHISHNRCFNLDGLLDVLAQVLIHLKLQFDEKFSDLNWVSIFMIALVMCKRR